jgi:osmotically-inducible protein OsmY
MFIQFAGPALRVAAALVATLGVLACAATQPPRTAEDEVIAAQVKSALMSAPYVYAQHVDVDSHHGVVTLSGWVYSDADLRAAERISKAVPGVQRVDNGVEILEPAGAPR